jgi:hypothetical protein
MQLVTDDIDILAQLPDHRFGIVAQLADHAPAWLAPCSVPVECDGCERSLRRGCVFHAVIRTVGHAHIVAVSRAGDPRR